MQPNYRVMFLQFLEVLRKDMSEFISDIEKDNYDIERIKNELGGLVAILTFAEAKLNMMNADATTVS